MTFVRDASHWLFKLSPEEWLRAALGELRRAEAAFGQKSGRAGLAGARRAAGMALNGVLVLEPNESWGQSYMDHLRALRDDRSPRVPARVREACALLLDTPMPGGELLAIRSAQSDERTLEAARDVVAHAYACVRGMVPSAEGPA